MNADALTVWLADHPTAAQDAPDLVALARTLASALDESTDEKVIPSLALQLRQTLLALRNVTASEGDGQADLARDLSTAD